MSSNITIESFGKVKKHIIKHRRRTGRIRRIIRSRRPRFRTRTITRIVRYPRHRRVVFTYRYPTYSIPLYRTVVVSPSYINRKTKVNTNTTSNTNKSNENYIFLILIALIFGFILGNIYYKNY